MFQRTRLLAVVLVLCLVPAIRAAEPFHYPEGKHGKGELKYINGLPVLTVAGTPEEIGEQTAVLGVKAGNKLLGYPEDVLKSMLKASVPAAAYDTAYKTAWRYFSDTGTAMVRNFPPDYKKEMDSLIKTGQFNRTQVVVGNTMFDAKNVLLELQKMFGCSVLTVEPERSATGGMLFGRNLDFPTVGYLNEYSLVTVCKPEGKHAFVSVGFPGVLGCLSGMNDAGLTLAVLEVYQASDESAKFDAKGTPYALCFRKLLEECTTIEEAEKALREMKRATLMNLAIADTKHAAVFEFTPKSLVVRKADDHLCPCTNHFRTKELCTSTKCYRYDRLAKAQEMDKLDVAAIAKKLDSVSQGDYTIQTMIFEPATLKLHLAIGKCPTSALPMKELDLRPLLTR